MTDKLGDILATLPEQTTWPCPACGATDPERAAQRCLDETSNHECGHSRTETPCPMDAVLEKAEEAAHG